MNFTSFARLICLATMFSGFSAYGLVYKISVWHHDDTGQQVFIMHTLTTTPLGSQKTEQQKLELLQAMRELQGYAIYLDNTEYTGNEQAILNLVATTKAVADKPTGGLIALLDTLPDDNFDYASITSWQQFSGKGISMGLGSFIQEAQLSGINAVCRHAMLASSLGHGINFDQLLQKTDELVSSVASFNDGQQYSDFYEARIAHFREKNQDILHDHEVAIPLDFEQPLIQSAMVLPFARLIHYGEELDDANIVHHLCLAKNHKNIFMILPANNAETINNAMPSLGYEHVESIGKKYWRDSLQSRIAFYPLDIPTVFKNYGCLFATSVTTPVSSTQLSWFARLVSYIKQLVGMS